MDMSMFCIPELSASVKWLFLLPAFIIIGAILYFDRKESTLSSEEYRSAGAVLICVATSVLFVLVLPNTPSGHANMETLFGSPLTLLTIVIGLAAYSSTILTKLRESITKANTEVEKKSKGVEKYKEAPAGENDTAKKQREAELSTATAGLTKSTDKLNAHKDNYVWLAWADRLLVVNGVMLIVTIVLWTLGVICPLYRSLVMSLFLAVVLYFARLHIRQWNRSIYKRY